ncbi:MAG: hypothetical protein F6K31_34555 [Symploca sp. SIO2G7]|nr:hypothetical protein [Symploca sp. SIO2G7]
MSMDDTLSGVILLTHQTFNLPSQFSILNSQFSIQSWIIDYSGLTCTAQQY